MCWHPPCVPRMPPPKPQHSNEVTLDMSAPAPPFTPLQGTHTQPQQCTPHTPYIRGQQCTPQLHATPAPALLNSMHTQPQQCTPQLFAALVIHAPWAAQVGRGSCCGCCAAAPAPPPAPTSLGPLRPTPAHPPLHTRPPESPAPPLAPPKPRMPCPWARPHPAAAAAAAAAAAGADPCGAAGSTLYRTRHRSRAPGPPHRPWPSQ